MRLSLLILVFFTVQANAILPLPYPLNPSETEPLVSNEVEFDPKRIPAFSELFEGGQKREKELPTFGKQKYALGYEQGATTFEVPPGLRKRVDFWKRIYTEFTSHEVVIHDSDYPEIVYAIADISPLMKDDSVPHRRKLRAINNFLKAEKKKFVDQLLKVHANAATPSNIPAELFPIFRKFETISEADKYLMATQRVRAQVGQRDKVVQGFFYGGRYFDRMMKVFEDRKIPKELTRLPLVESAFNLSARSKVGASGVWQFMRATGKRYLRIDRAVDERNDPLLATFAAADLLESNFKKLGSWPLAVTAYNHGPEGMDRAVREIGSSDLVKIIHHYKARTFGFASSNFYSEFLAMLEVERDYRKYFGKILVDSPLSFEELSFASDTTFESLTEACRLSAVELGGLNPALTDWVTSGKGYIPAGYSFKVPLGAAAKCRSGARNLDRAIGLK